MAPIRSKSTPGMTRSVLPDNAAQRRGVRPTQVSTGSLRALIAAASVAVTMGGWSALAFSDAQAQAQTAQDTQAQYDASAVLAVQQSNPSVSFPEIPAVPTLVPAPAHASGNTVPQAAAPQQPASTLLPQQAAPSQSQPALRSVTLPNASAQRPAPFTRSRSSR